MAGCAFSIKDALIAMRWAGQIRSRGYHVVVTPGYENADEVIEVFIPDTTKPTFKVHRATNSVLITDCIGLTLLRSGPAACDGNAWSRCRAWLRGEPHAGRIKRLCSFVSPTAPPASVC